MSPNPHLALVHVARRLVEVGEGGEARDEREDVGRLELAVRALARLDVLLLRVRVRVRG